MKNVLQQLAKSAFIPLGLIATVSAALTITLRTTTLIISNEEMKDIIKTVKSLKNFALLLKGVSETIRNKEK